MTTSQKYTPIRQARSVRLQVRDSDYHLLEWGDARLPHLFLLHGWGDCAASFQFLVDRLSAQWFVVAPDWRGFGRTATRQPSYWFPDYIADLDEILAHYRADAPVSLVGHSMGANVASLYAGIFPERVATFVNIEGFGLPPRDAADAPDNYRHWIVQSRNVPAYRAYVSFDELAQRVQKRAPYADFGVCRFVAEHWGVTGRDRSVTLRADAAHRLPNAILYRRREAEACWQRISASVLAIAGAESEFRAAAGPFLDACNGSSGNREIVTLPGCGHMVHLEAPGALARAIERVLAEELCK